jgi:hypothetical protein
MRNQLYQPATARANLLSADHSASNLPIFLAFSFVGLCSALPVLMHRSLPLVDLPNHIARHHVAANSGSEPISRYYSTTDEIVPNSAVDLLWRLLGYPLDVELFSQLLTAFQNVALVAAVMVLARVVHGRWTMWSAASGLLVWNMPLLFGFQNFTFSLPFAILGIALWIQSERWILAYRLAAFTVIALCLYVMHFFAFTTLAIAVLGRQVQIIFLQRHALSKIFFESICLALPFLVPVAWLFWGILYGEESLAGNRTSYGGVLERLLVIFTPFFSPFLEDGFLLIITGVVAGMLVLGSLLTLLTRRKGPRMVMAQPLVGPVLALLAASMLAPSWLNGVALVHIRTPLALLAVLIAGTVWIDARNRSLYILAAIVALSVLSRAIVFERLAKHHSGEMVQLRQVLVEMPEGSRLFTVRGEGNAITSRLSHTSSYAVIDRDSFTPGLFQGVHSLEVRDEWRNASHPAQPTIDECAAIPDACLTRVKADYTIDGSDVALRFIADWPCKFTHLLTMDRPVVHVEELTFLRPLKSEGRFSLFEILVSPDESCRRVLQDPLLAGVR